MLERSGRRPRLRALNLPPTIQGRVISREVLITWIRASKSELFQLLPLTFRQITGILTKGGHAGTTSIRAGKTNARRSGIASVELLALRACLVGVTTTFQSEYFLPAPLQAQGLR